jgi:hypothetical protein
MTTRRCYLAAVLLVALLVTLLASQAFRPALADQDADALAVRAVIEGQMAAFQRNDSEAAYAYASPEVKTVFTSPEMFMHMVRMQYLPVYRPKSVEFRETYRRDGEFAQKLLVIGPRKKAAIAIYTLRKFEDEQWLITGVYLSPAPIEDRPL